jgi:hypothetical protein
MAVQVGIRCQLLLTAITGKPDSTTSAQSAGVSEGPLATHTIVRGRHLALSTGMKILDRGFGAMTPG